MDESLQQSTAQGLNEADPAENLITIAPNVGRPRSAPVDRRDTGYDTLANLLCQSWRRRRSLAARREAKLVR